MDTEDKDKMLPVRTSQQCDKDFICVGQVNRGAVRMQCEAITGPNVGSRDVTILKSHYTLFS